MKIGTALMLFLTGLLLTGCAAKVRETHYFASYNNQSDAPPQPANFFRLKVKGGAQFSSARYLAGFYDERAVDLFFNEIRTDESNKSTLFTADLKEPGSDQTIKPLSPSAGNGAFVLIMSTDADSVANAIGSFAESQVVATAITNLVAKERIKEKVKSDAIVTVASDRGTALESQLNTLLTEARTQSDPKVTEKAYLRLLNALARALGHDSGFASFAEARTWFQLERSASEG